MDYTNLKERMEKSIGAYQEKLSEIRAGRANPAILNKVKVDYYGTPTPINQMAGISVPEARLIVIQPWDMSVLKDIEKAIEKLKLQEKRLVDLYLSSNLDVETINHKNDVIKKEIDKLNQKKVRLDPDNNSKEYTIELVKKLDCTEKNNTLFFTNIKNIGFIFLYDLLSREAKRDMIHRLISMIEIKRDKNYNIEIKDIKFTDEFITKSSKEYLKYLNNIMNDNNIGIKFHKEIDEIELKNMESNYDILSIKKMKHKEYSNKFLKEFISKSQEHLYIDGIVSCPYIEGNTIKDILILVPKNKLINTI